MSATQLDPEWLASLLASAERPPLRPRVPLLWQQSVIGSVEADYFDSIMPSGSSVVPELLQQEQGEGGLQWRVQGDITASLARIARALFDARVGHVVNYWRNEQLAVCDEQGRQLGTVERGVVRPLGIASHAVHLVGRSVDGCYWVQQRSFDKASDPGLWDTLMGGMVSATDDVESALERETWEEAGLRLHDLHDVQRGGRVDLRKPILDDGSGYVVEQTDWYHCTVPDGVLPVNQDGEVEQFLLLDRASLIGKLQRNEFTTEAALILVAALRRG